MKRLAIFSFILFSYSIQAQINDSVLFAKHEKQIAILEQQYISLQQQNSALQKDIILLEQRTSNIATKLDVADSTIASVDNRYGLQFEQTDSTIQNNEAKRQKSVLWGIVIAVLLALVSAVVYLILRIRIAKKGNDIELLRARADDLNRQIVERMDKELEELQKVVASIPEQKNGDENQSSIQDHSIVLAIGDNLAIMESNLYRMDSKTPGHRSLTRAVEKMKSNLLQKGYDFVNMLGEEYVEGLNVDKVVFKDDDSIEEGKQIITAVRRPQINYNGIAIQLANIEVSQNI